MVFSNMVPPCGCVSNFPVTFVILVDDVLLSPVLIDRRLVNGYLTVLSLAHCRTSFNK